MSWLRQKKAYLTLLLKNQRYLDLNGILHGPLLFLHKLSRAIDRHKILLFGPLAVQMHNFIV